MPEPPTGALRGRTVAITGAAQGIGAAMAQAFANAGATTLLLDRQPIASPPAGGRSVVCDVTDAAACRAALADEPVDVLINNAGISEIAPFAQTSDDAFRRVLDVNVLGTVYCTRAALPSIRARRGVVVTVSSVAGFAPLVGRTAYCASKHALHGFMDSLRAELGSAGEDVAIVLVCPTFVDTPIHAPGVVESKAIGRVQTPEDVASTVLAAVVRRGPAVVFPSTLGRVAWWVSRLAPRLYDRLMTRASAGAQPDAPELAEGQTTEPA